MLTNDTETFIKKSEITMQVVKKLKTIMQVVKKSIVTHINVFKNLQNV
jgi:translation initiation factor 2 alpha subunit (eIF-2alpha)